MNKIIPFTNSIILYFLFSFFFISKFSKLKKFFQKIFHTMWGIFVPRFLIHALYPPPVMRVLSHVKALPNHHVTTLSLQHTKVHNHSLECMNIHFPIHRHLWKNFPAVNMCLRTSVLSSILQNICSENDCSLSEIYRTCIHEHLFSVKIFLSNFSKIIFCRLSVCEYNFQ